MSHQVARRQPITSLLLAIALIVGMLVAMRPSDARAAAPVTKIVPMYNGCAHPEKIPAEARRYAKEQGITLCQGDRLFR